MRYLSIFAACVALSFGGNAFAQNGSDPKLSATVVSEFLLADPPLLEEATLTREAPGAFTGRVSWRVRLTNNAANDLNLAVFTAQSVVGGIGATAAPMETGTTENPLPGGVIPIEGVPNCALAPAIPAGTKTVCQLGTVLSKHSVEFVVIVRTPTAGTNLRLDWTFGGTEGNGGTNGCCTRSDSTSLVALVDATIDPTVKTHVQSTMVPKVLNVASTGRTDTPTAEDPWKTTVTLGDVYQVDGQDAKLTQLLLDEFLTADSCGALQNNQCWRSKLTIPDTTWTAADPLKIRLDRHSSAIKNGSQISNYVVEYQGDTEANFSQIFACPVDWGTGSNLRPCLEKPCEEFPLTTKPKTYMWSCSVKALGNGSYRIGN